MNLIVHLIIIVFVVVRWFVLAGAYGRYIAVIMSYTLIAM